MRYSVALPTEISDKARSHLIREDGQEDVCFGLYSPSQGADRYSGLIVDLVMPEEGDRTVQGNVRFSTAYFVRVLGIALKRNLGIAVMHSHPAGQGWQFASDDDLKSENTYAHTAFGGTSLPLIGMTLSGDYAWSARVWRRVGRRKYDCNWCEKVRVVGSSLVVNYNPKMLPIPQFKEKLSRTVSAWGPQVQAQIARLRIGIVGVGGVGSIVAEALARMGMQEILLIDFDSVEFVNLDRLLHSLEKDAQTRQAKVQVIAKAIKKSSTANKFVVKAFENSVIEPEGFVHALDCDVLFSCVDRPWPRSVLNFIAYAHLIPVIDGGVRVIVNPNGTLKKADWGSHVVGNGRRCMACLEQYDPGLVAAERDGLLDDPEYIKGLDEDNPIRHNENVFSFNLSVASMNILQF
ncbi:MAG: ThiF family adenylyltransferase, partial [Rhabdochlamydiaceae bacterium]